jgi:hypothetical protein
MKLRKARAAANSQSLKGEADLTGETSGSGSFEQPWLGGGSASSQRLAGASSRVRFGIDGGSRGWGASLIDSYCAMLGHKRAPITATGDALIENIVTTVFRKRLTLNLHSSTVGQPGNAGSMSDPVSRRRFASGGSWSIRCRD